jgi:adenylate cyclase class 2
MFEVEVKARIDDVAVFERALLECGAEFLRVEEHVDVYYNNVGLRDFRVSDEALRLRRRDGGVLLTYKGRRVEGLSKSRCEIECGVSSFECMDAILRVLGFLPAGRVVKKRRVYSLGDFTVCLDDVVGLGCFVEVELSCEREEDVEEGVLRVVGLLERLGVPRGGLIRESYLELLG